MTNAYQLRNAAYSKTVIKALESRYFDAYYCETGAEAVQKALELIPAGSVIGYGGSTTVSQLGLLDHFRNENYKLLDRDNAGSAEEKDAVQRAIFSADWFIASTNALSEDGILVNIDGTGNRVAPMIYGPKNVLIIAGMNKVTKDFDSAWKRARGTAAPINMARFAPLKSPCKETGACADCKSPDCICAYISTIRISRPAHKIKVILVGENLGF